MLAKPSQSITLRYKSPFRDTTLFPQVKIYEAGSDAIVSGGTVNLSASAVDTSLYTGTFTVPAAEGVYTLVYIPYSDSGRTTKSDAEGDIIENLEVRQIASSGIASSMGAIGITENDVKDIAKLVAKELKKGIKVDAPAMVCDHEDVDLTPIIAEIRSIPKAEPAEIVDLSPVISEVRQIGRQIKPMDIAPILNAAADIRSSLKGAGDLENKIQIFIGQLGIMADNLTEVSQLQNLIKQFLSDMANHKEMMLKADDLNKARMSRLVEVVQQSGFMNQANFERALKQVSVLNELE